MKKILIVISAVVLMGCNTAPVIPTFPHPPEELLQPCEPLSTIDKSEVLLSEFTKTVVHNYGKYHTCAAIVEAWQEWYKENSKIFNEVNK